MKKIIITFFVIAGGYLGAIIIAYLPWKTINIEEFITQEDKFIEVEGKRIHYLKQGEGRPIILVHGFGLSTFSWRKLIPLLSKRYTVFALDLLGFGLSDKPTDGDYTLEAQARLVINFMDALRIPSATLIGHSMGGVVVSRAAVESPSRIESLVLINSGFYGGKPPSFLKYLFFPFPRLLARYFFSRSFREKILKRTYYDPSLITNEAIEKRMIYAKTPHVLEALTKMVETLSNINNVGLTENIRRLTLIIWGEEDRVIDRAEPRRIHSEIRGSQLKYIKECGHMALEEKPEEMAVLIFEFLKD